MGKIRLHFCRGNTGCQKNKEIGQRLDLKNGTLL